LKHIFLNKASPEYLSTGELPLS